MTSAVKTCSKCGEVKGVGEFGKSGYVKKDGIQSPHPWCKACCLAASGKYNYRFKKYSDSHKEKISEYMKKKYTENPEKNKERARKWRRENPSRMRDTQKRWRENQDRFLVALATSKRNARREGYEPCNATYREIVSAFTGFCAVCGIMELECKAKLRMDHDHVTGFFRGWLCHRCNAALGFVRDDVTILDGMIKYLENQKQEQLK